MNRKLVYIGCVAALLTACSEGPSVDFPDAQVGVAQAQVDPSLPAEKPEPQSKAIEKDSEENAALAEAHVKPILLHAPPYMTPELSQQYVLLRIKCEAKSRSKISAVMLVGDGWEPTENGGRKLITSSREITSNYRQFWQSNSVYFDETLAVFPPLYEKITKQVPNGNGGIVARTERRFLGDNAVRDVILPNLKTAKTMRLENISNGAPGPSFDLTTINSDIERLEAECTPKDATNAK